MIMIEGIEILNKMEIMKSPIWITVIGIFCCVLALVGCGMLLFDMITDFLKGKWWISPLIIILSYVGILLTDNLNKNLLIEPTGQYKYQVTIDDNVSMNEFFKRYEIIEINGKIYTIKERE